MPSPDGEKEWEKRGIAEIKRMPLQHEVESSKDCLPYLIRRRYNLYNGVASKSFLEINRYDVAGFFGGVL